MCKLIFYILCYEYEYYALTYISYKNIFSLNKKKQYSV